MQKSQKEKIATTKSMPEAKKQEMIQKMLQVSNLIEQGSKNIKVEKIVYYKDFAFEGSQFAETNLIVAQIIHQKENITTYELYSANTNSLIATVNSQGKIQFMPEYLQKIRQISKGYIWMLDLEDLQFILPKQLEEEDIVLTWQERQQIQENEKYNGAEESILGGSQNSSIESDQKMVGQKLKRQDKEQEKEIIAQKTKTSIQNIFPVRKNSNFYKDHPELEDNLFFRKDNQGIVRAEYIDQNGEVRPSKYFQPSTTNLRQQTVSLGNDGRQIEKQVPYQTMQTKGLNHVDKDIKDIRICIDMDAYGYIQIKEARQGNNGKWLSHDIELRGRQTNSQIINESTSIHTRRANPAQETGAYEQIQEANLDKEPVQYNEMYLIAHTQEIIESLINKGYQKKEAVQIVNYMIGEEKLTLEQAKKKVNRQIQENVKLGEKQDNKDDNQERTPWNDAEQRRVKINQNK